MKKNIQISSPSLNEEEWFSLKVPLSTGWITQGPMVAGFERAFAEMHNVDYGIAATSCTAALHLALLALGIGEGDEVIVPSFTWIATANAVEYVGAKPVFCDIDEETYNIDPKQVESLLTGKTRAVIPVHLFGLCADMGPLIMVCSGQGVHIIEDAACAAGASYKGKMAGSFGDIGCFSFHPRKIITTGEGGMCTTGDAGIADRIIRMRNHGASISEEERNCGPKPFLLPDFPMLGFNYRMTDLQGAIGLIQLGKLNAFIEERRFWVRYYNEQLNDIDWLRLPAGPDGYGHTYQSFVCFVDEKKAHFSRNELMERLFEHGISTRPGTHAVHMQAYYAEKYGIHPDDFPNARDCAKHTIALPLHNRMTEEDYHYVIQCLKGYS